MRKKTLIIFGAGYSGRAIAAELHAAGWRVYGTSRSAASLAALKEIGGLPLRWEGGAPSSDLCHALEACSCAISTIAPQEGSDPVVALWQDFPELFARITQAIYLSTTGVYGDLQGKTAYETTPLAPISARSKARVRAELEWSARPVLPSILRLSGIYGPRRSAIEQLQTGRARIIEKPGHLFNRIHVADIAGVVAALIAQPERRGIYNLADDLPAASGDVMRYAAQLLGVDPPPPLAFELAELSPMAASFYAESKIISNARLKAHLGYRLRFPDYRSGLEAIRKRQISAFS